MLKLLRYLRARANANSKFYYLIRCRRGAVVLDVGCGNDSPAKFKGLRSDIEYYGLDISDYFITEDSKARMDRYIVVPPEEFDKSIAQYKNHFDLIVCAHNIEHCYRPDLVVDAICEAVAEDGVVFFSFPSEGSVAFPKRRGTLNFYDDPTHRTVPDFRALERVFRSRNFDVLVARPRARYWPEVLIGALFEPVSMMLRRTMPGTWALWGFESVLVVRKKPAAGSEGGPVHP